VKTLAPLKVLGRVGLRAKGAVNGDLSGEAASVRQPDVVDKQISALLQSLEVELRQAPPPRHAGRPPNVSSPTSSLPVRHERPTKSTLDRRPRTLIRPPRRAVAKGRGLDRARAHRRIRRRLVGDPAAREDVLVIITAVMIGIGVGLAIPLLIR
jgi:hypothetical protein